jgi:hypothetical protein
MKCGRFIISYFAPVKWQRFGKLFAIVLRGNVSGKQHQSSKRRRITLNLAILTFFCNLAQLKGFQLKQFAYYPDESTSAKAPG